ncbi:monofunctional biosynthetic peptidoglycan transglycosylase [Dinoroseobacter shibae]|uniref:monofunctional biosynthetic peptidoglycan transglycosylase n=1 Tax=Dinoroseobacter shibae TaxID=215813 RepID=UPI0005C60799
MPRKTRAKAKPRRKAAAPSWRARLRLWVLRGVLGVVGLGLAWIVAYRWIDPPTTPYILAERARLGAVQQDWVPMERIAPDLARAVVAAEDANFCRHWGFDMAAIRDAIEAGGNRGASTLSQQVVKNVFLWHGRSWPRKALEALITPVMEATWPKRRILEVYLNVAEFDAGVFGVGAAAPHYFGTAAGDVSLRQAAALAVVLPNPKARSARSPGPGLQRRAASVADGAETIRRDGRSACFED